jgi:hypothetical protein
MLSHPLSCPCLPCSCWFCAGLDSATLYSITSFFKQVVGALQSNVLISLLQPPPEVMGPFDDVMLMHEG